MDLESFKRSLDQTSPPGRLTAQLHALWHAAKGDWEASHRLVQSEEGWEAAWVHAHLHRIEGDLSNAGYWYRRAGRPSSEQSLPQEWAEIAGELLSRVPA